MKNGKNTDNTIAVEIADLIFDNIDSVKTHLNLDSYDTTAVVMRITAASDGEGGVSEAKLAQQLNITRPTMNRIIRRLLDTRHILAISDTSPKKYIFNFDYEPAQSKSDSKRAKLNFQRSVIDRCVAALLAVFWSFERYQFENEDE